MWLRKSVLGIGLVDPYTEDMATSADTARTMLPVHQAGQCSVAAASEIVGAKWTALIVHDLSEGPRRFT
jgi:DNA-binding HxlR family transcriptional regulator